MLVAQITDTHIRPKGRLAYGGIVDTASALRRLVAHIENLAPDAVIVTGDLTDFDTAEEYAHFRELVAPLAAPLFPIPGNHDSTAGVRAAFPELAPHLTRDDLCYAVDAFPVRLVMLDSSVPGAPYGELGADRLAWLAASLDERPHRPTLVSLHHPPFLTGIRHMDVQNLRDAAALGEVLARHAQVRALVCGHVHRAVLGTFAGRAASIGPAPAHAVSLALDPSALPSFHIEPASLYVHYFDAASDTFVTHQSFVGGGSGPHPFFDAAGRLIP